MIGKYILENKNHKVFCLITLFVCFVILAGLVFALKYVIDDVKNVQTNTANTIQNNNIKNFTVFFDKINTEANINVKNISNNIEKSIKDNYDLDILKKELDGGDYSNLSSIITPFIKEAYLNGVTTDKNSIFVATSRGIICDYAYSYMNNLKPSNVKHDYRPWQDFIDNSYNKKLSEMAISNLINKNSDIILIQYHNPKSKYNIDYTEITSENIASYYNKYGVDIFKDIEILVPYYITNEGDIFGQKDIDQGVRYENYKLIIVQRINLYEQIKHSYPTLITNKSMEEFNITYNRIMCCMYITGLIVTIVIILIIMQLCYNFNKYIIGDEEKSQEKS